MYISPTPTQPLTISLRLYTMHDRSGQCPTKLFTQLLKNNQIHSKCTSPPPLPKRRLITYYCRPRPAARCPDDDRVTDKFVHGVSERGSPQIPAFFGVHNLQQKPPPKVYVTGPIFNELFFQPANGRKCCKVPCNDWSAETLLRLEWRG